MTVCEIRLTKEAKTHVEELKKSADSNTHKAFIKSLLYKSNSPHQYSDEEYNTVLIQVIV